MKDIVKKAEDISKNVAAGATVIFFSLKVPAASKVVLTHFSNYADEPTAWGSLTWIVKKNGLPVYPYNAIKDQYGLAAEPRPIQHIEFRGGDLFEIEVVNNFSGAVGMGVGFFYQFEGTENG